MFIINSRHLQNFINNSLQSCRFLWRRLSFSYFFVCLYCIIQNFQEPVSNISLYSGATSIAILFFFANLLLIGITDTEALSRPDQLKLCSPSEFTQ